MLGIELLSWYNVMLVDFTLTHTSVWETFHWEEMGADSMVSATMRQQVRC